MLTTRLQQSLRAHGVDPEALAAYFAMHPVRNVDAALRDLAVTLSRALRRGTAIPDRTAWCLTLATKYV